MKGFSMFLVLCLGMLFATAQSFLPYRVTNAGATLALAPTQIAYESYVYSSGSVTLGNNWSINYTSPPAPGFTWRVYFDVSSVTVGAFSISIFGQSLTSQQIANGGYYEFTSLRDHTGIIAPSVVYSPGDLNSAQILNGAVLIDGTVNMDAIDSLGRARVYVGNSSNELTSIYAGGTDKFLIGDGNDLKSYAVAGDISLTVGVSTISSAIGAGVIVNADVSAAAAIDRSKLASGTADHVLINDASGIMSSEALLNVTRGGTGMNAAGLDGFLTFASGVAAVGSFTDSKTIMVSFDSTATADMRSDNKVKMPFAGTVTGLYAYAVSDIAGVNNATIVPKNNAGTTMGSGTITFTAADPKGTAYTSTPSGSNTFIAGDILYFTTSKPDDPGGNVLLTITYTRNN